MNDYNVTFSTHIICAHCGKDILIQSNKPNHYMRVFKRKEENKIMYDIVFYCPACFYDYTITTVYEIDGKQLGVDINEKI